FLRFRWVVKNHPPYRCVTTFVGTMGAQDAAATTAIILDRYAPANMVLIGIAGSLTKDALIGDVVIADEVDDYLQDAKVTEQGVQAAGRHYRGHPRLCNILRYIGISKPQLWEELVRQSHIDQKRLLKKQGTKDLKRILGTEGPQIHVGHIASGPVVGASTEFSSWLKTLDRKHIAIEMEAAGLMNAVYEGAGDERVLIIRGISDFADERKESLDSFNKGALRALAMRNALRVMEVLVQTNSFDYAIQVENDRDCRIFGKSAPSRAAYGDIQIEFRNKVYRIGQDRGVRVFGFTYAAFWTLMRELLADPKLKNWTFDLHYISPQFVKANPLVFARYWLADASSRENEMREWFAGRANIASLAKRRIKVRLRSFDLIPFLHGKAFADGSIFLHSAQWEEGGKLSYPN